jgi:hypothetical protein
MRIKLGTAVDAQGMEVEIWHTDNVGQQKGLAVAYLKATTYLLERNWAMAPFDLATNSHRGIWLEKDGEVLGGVIYEYHTHNKQGWIVLIFTEEKYRGRHLYSIIQQAFEEEVIKLGATSIASMAHKDNAARLKAGAREGMLPQYLRLYKDLTPGLDQRKQQLAEKTGKPWKEINLEKWAPPPWIKKS